MPDIVKYIEIARSFLATNLVFLQTAASVLSLGTTIIGWIAINKTIKKLQRGHLKSKVYPLTAELAKLSGELFQLSSSEVLSTDHFHRNFSEKTIQISGNIRAIEETLDDDEFLKKSKAIRKDLLRFAHIPLKKKKLLRFGERAYTPKELNDIGFNISMDLTEFANLITMRINQSKDGVPNV
jgi:hypothetical protein